MDEQIRQILLKCLEVDTKIQNEKLSIDLEEWDSLHHIQIVLEIEDKYDLPRFGYVVFLSSIKLIDLKLAL